MTQLSDTQRILLSGATQRATGALLPLPASLKAGGGTAKAILALIKRGHAEERETTDPAAACRTDGDIHYGVFITVAGGSAIGINLAESARDAEPSIGPATQLAPNSQPASKAALVVSLLGRTQGATMPELVEATGWLPHTTRAALTGLRKKGHTITRDKRDDATCYRIVEAG